VPAKNAHFVMVQIRWFETRACLLPSQLALSINFCNLHNHRRLQQRTSGRLRLRSKSRSLEDLQSGIGCSQSLLTQLSC